VSNFDQSANCQGVHAGIGMLGHGRMPMSETDQFWEYAKLPDRRIVFAWLVLTFVATVIYFFRIYILDKCADIFLVTADRPTLLS
jgi:hypothetical protein